jgi:hypothetical protein
MGTSRGGFVVAGLTLALTVMGCSSGTPADPMNTPSLDKGGRAGPIGTVYVRSQGLYYDTFVSAEQLPMHGRFQKLENGETDFGPGDPGYLGGRWWIDGNGNGIQDAGDTFLLCPLLPPGRPTP